MHHPFLRKLATLIGSSDKDMRHCTVVLPSRRSAYYLGRLIAEESRGSLWMPAFTTMNEWCAHISGLRPIDRLELRFAAYRAYANVLGEQAQDISTFFSWCDALLDDFNELEAHGLDHNSVYRDLEAYTEIDSFSFLNQSLTERQKSYRNLWHSLKMIHEKLNASLLEQGKAYSGLLSRKAAERWPEYRLQYPEQKHYVAGFNALSRSEKDLLKQVLDAGDGELYFDADPAWLQDLENPAGMFIRNALAEKLGSSLTGAQAMRERQLDITHSRAAYKSSQVDVIAAILAELSPDELNDTSLVLADESMLIPLLQRLPANVQEANVSMGVPLSSGALSDWLDKLFVLKQRNVQRGAELWAPLDQLRRLCRHKLMELLSAQGWDEELLAFTRGQQVDLQAWLQALIEKGQPTFLHGLLEDWEGSAAAALRALKHFAERAAMALAESSQGGIEARMLGDSLHCLGSFVQQLQSFPQAGELSLEDVRQLLSSAFRAAKLDLIGEPAHGLQIMGLLETRALSYKCIILCDATHEFLPGTSSPERFFPFEVRQFHQLPGRRERDAVFGYYFYRLLQDAEKVHLVYYYNFEGLSSGAEPSPFLLQLEHRYSQLMPGLSYRELPAAKFSGGREQGPSGLEKSPEVMQDIRRYVQERISASGINRYLESSLEWYYENVLGLAEPDEQDGIDEAQFGSVVHDCLEQLFATKVDRGALSAYDLDGWMREIDGHLSRSFRKICQGTHFDRGLERLQYASAKHMILDYLGSEQDLLSKGDTVEVLQPELRLKRSLKIEPADGTEALPAMIKGSADLVLRRNGKLQVIDFKTGKVEGSDLKLAAFDLDSVRKKPKALQLMLYAWMLREVYPDEQAEAMIISMPRPADRKLLLQPALERDEDVQDCEALLAQIIREMLDPAVPLAANPDFEYARFEPL